MTIAPVLRAAHVRQAPAEAFRLFTDRIGAWWPLPTHGLFGARAGGVSFEDGALVERSVTGGRTVWAEVLAWEPPDRLVLAWHPGRSDGPRSEVEVRFHPDEHGTRVELVHRGWEAFGEDGAAASARGSYEGPTAWGFVLDHFADVADRVVHTADLEALAGAYDAFFAEAAAGAFGPPADGEWNAAQVVAHVALNDDAMAAVCRSLIHGAAPAFGNEPCQDRGALDAVVASAGGSLAGVVGVAHERAETVRLLLGRLDDDQLATEVPCRLLDHGAVVLDAPMAWRKLAVDTQAGFHLPLHTEQLRALSSRAR